MLLAGGAATMVLALSEEPGRHKRFGVFNARFDPTYLDQTLLL